MISKAEYDFMVEVVELAMNKCKNKAEFVTILFLQKSKYPEQPLTSLLANVIEECNK